MGFMDSFNNLTDKINKAVNELAGMVEETTTSVIQNSNAIDPSTATEGSLDKLGAINLTTNGEPMETPGSLLKKPDMDKRKLATDLKRFTTVVSYKSYLEDYFISTGLFNVEKSEYNDSFTIQLTSNVNNDVFVSKYRIFATPSMNEVKALIDNIKTTNIPDNTEKFVALGYYRYDNSVKQEANNLGLELFGAEEIIEVNGAIDMSEKGMPYMSFSKKSLHSILANSLNNKYRSLMEQMQNANVNNNFNNNNVLPDVQNNIATENGSVIPQQYIAEGPGFGGLGATIPETVNTTTDNSKVDLSKKP